MELRMIALQLLVVTSLAAQNPWTDPFAHAQPAPRQNPFEAYQEAQRNAAIQHQIQLQNQNLEQQRINLELQNQALEQKLQSPQQPIATPATAQRAPAPVGLSADTQRWYASIAAAKAKHPDFDEVMARPHLNVVPPFVATVVTDRDNGAELAYWLTLHPDAEKRLVESAAIPSIPTDRDLRRAYVRIDHELDRIADGK